MVRKYFGTDGIRGKANEGAMTAEPPCASAWRLAVSFVAVTTAIVS